jgi:hypothetical protein
LSGSRLLRLPARPFSVWCRSKDGFVALRKGPGTAHPVVARMKEGDEVQAIDDADKNGWMPVRHWWGFERHDDKTRPNNRKGFAHKRYIGECG